VAINQQLPVPDYCLLDVVLVDVADSATDGRDEAQVAARDLVLDGSDGVTQIC